MGSKKGTSLRFYPEEIKQEVIRMKLSGDSTNAEIMEIHQIKNRSQIKTWMKWQQILTKHLQKNKLSNSKSQNK